LFYYEVAIVSKKLSLLTYSSLHDIKNIRVVYVRLKSKKVLGVCINKVYKPSFDVQEIDTITDNYYSSKQLQVATFISTYYFCELSESLSLFQPFCDVKKSSDTTFQILDTIILSTKQQKAIDFIQKRTKTLLFGDTGSGKTEVYIQLFINQMSISKSSLFLLPEIGLTPQMKLRLEKYFGDDVIFWHSKLTKKAKDKNLERIRDKNAKVIVGTRSALFLPIGNLGLIIVDEEHDDSYKSSSTPRYHARDIALYYAKKLDISIVLGSATPSLATYKNIGYIRLKGSYYQAKKEYAFENTFDFISPNIISSLDKNLAKSKQSICFVPTRANFKYLTCNRCGYSYECPFCSVAMSYHKQSNAYKCHYCNYMEAFNSECPKCRVGRLDFNRMGTSEVVDILSHKLQKANVVKFDRDEITTEKKLKELLNKFNLNEIDILVGTQMLSKGHDYHDVTLAIIFGIDTYLHQSDYRSREKALSLLIQIAGRSGRKEDAKVIIQTFNKDFFSKYIDDYESFLQDELRLREKLYPPYKRLARVLFSHSKREKAHEHMTLMLIDLQRYHEIEIIGYGSSQIERIANKFRFQILLRADKVIDLLKVLTACKTVHANIDMDPIDFN